MFNPPREHLKLFTGLLLGLYTVLFIWGSYENYQKHESRGIIALFAIPLLVQLVGLINLYFKPRQEGDEAVRTFFHVYWITMGLCAVFNCLLWLCYLKGGQSQAISHFALFFILILLSFVVIVTFAVLTPARRDSRIPQTGFRRAAVRKLLELREGVSRMPFWALLHFLTVFLTVSFLFGFAFAFHDKSIDTSQNSDLPPLYMTNLPNNRKSQPATAQASANSTACFNFYFPDGQANLEMFDENTAKGVRTLIEDGEFFEGNKKDKAVRSVNNQDSLGQVVAQILEISKRGQLARVNLIGHSDNRRIKGGPYPDNYALSQARLDMVRTEIGKGVHAQNKGEWCDIEWSLLPLSNDKFPEGRNYIERVCRLNVGSDERVVQVYIDSVSGGPSQEILRRFNTNDFTRLTLMDYMYFSIYTITTTGYGDIVPTTNYAKALTCFANICEMFFIIGLFNALVALRTDETRPQGEVAPAERGR